MTCWHDLFTRFLIAVLVCGIAVCSGSSRVHPQVPPSSLELLWSIGKADRSGKEFALFGAYPGFLRRFPGPVDYRIGVNQAGDWPYIHPGPVDAWAGSRVHPYRIRFHLDAVPRGECSLVIDTVSAQHDVPPVLQIDVNGESSRIEAAPGPGDMALVDERRGAPQELRLDFDPSLLHRGENNFTLAVVTGSWLLYDAVRLETRPDTAPRGISAARLEPSDRSVYTGTSLMQVEWLITSNSGPSTTVPLSLLRGALHRDVTVRVPFGEARIPLRVAPTKQAETLTAVLHLPGRVLTLSGKVLPQRHWTVFIVPSTHTDIGYTDYQAAVRRRHDEDIDIALRLCRQEPWFKWNCEVAWEARNYLADRPAAARREFLQRLKEGRIGLHAGYLNMLTGLMSTEELTRYPLFAAEVHRRYGIDTSAAILSDVPSASWSLAPALAGSGIRYFAEGINQSRGPTLAHTHIDAPFYWEAPDGSRVLTWLANGYGQGSWLAGATSDEAVGANVDSLVRQWDRPDYPYDAVYVYGAVFDNGVLDPHYGAALKEWNRKWAYPHVVLATSREFFRYLETHYRNRIPVRRGDFGAYWEDGAASSARETATNEQAKALLAAAERLWSLDCLARPGLPYPSGSFATAWQKILLYDEHTWGAAQSVSEPESAETRGQWAVKAGYANQAFQDAHRLLAGGLRSVLKAAPARKGDVVVVNPLPWARSGLVPLPAGFPRGAGILDERRRAIPLQSADGHFSFQSGNIPGLGIRVYRAARSPRPTLPSPVTRQARPGETIETPYYRLRLDASRGVASLFDRETHRELLDPQNPYGLAQVVYAAGGEGTSLIDFNLPQPLFAQGRPGTASAPPGHTVVLTPAGPYAAAAVAAGPLFTDVVLQASAPNLPLVATRLRIYRREKRIDVTVTLHKTATYHSEAVYVAFPFQARNPHFRLGMAAAVEDPVHDFIPGACYEWYAVPGWISCQDGNGPEVLWCSADAPLITLGHVNRGLWSGAPDLAGGTLFSYAMNNYWNTNYRAAQGGWVRLHYSLTSAAAPFSSSSCEHFSQETRTPLVSGISRGHAPFPLPSVEVSGPGAELAAFKKAEDGHGSVMILRNMTAHSTTAVVSVAAAQWFRAAPCSLVEGPMQGNIPTAHSEKRGSRQRWTTVRLAMRAMQIRAVRLLALERP